MKNKFAMYLVGPKLKVYGSNKTKQIKNALEQIRFNSKDFVRVKPKDFEPGWVIDIPVSENGKEFYLMTYTEEAIKQLPVDFAEQIQSSLNALKPPEFPSLMPEK